MPERTKRESRVAEQEEAEVLLASEQQAAANATDEQQRQYAEAARAQEENRERSQALPASTEARSAPEDVERAMSLDFFAATNGWRVDSDGNRVSADELMGGFVYQMRQRGRLADTESNYRTAFEAFCGL